MQHISIISFPACYWINACIAYHSINQTSINQLSVLNPSQKASPSTFHDQRENQVMPPQRASFITLLRCLYYIDVTWGWLAYFVLPSLALNNMHVCYTIYSRLCCCHEKLFLCFYSARIRACSWQDVASASVYLFQTNVMFSFFLLCFTYLVFETRETRTFFYSLIIFSFCVQAKTYTHRLDIT